MSLPSRERGLKYDFTVTVEVIIGSLPSRERGLKYPSMMHSKSGNRSLPSRERGLKSWVHIRNTALYSRSLRGSVD